DSLILKNALDENWKIPWRITSDERCIKRLIKAGKVTVVHTFREGNLMEDFFINVVFDFAGRVTFSSYKELPKR
ncbi:hypothetical protein MTR67_026537, partial [Solanum verrucosum]